MARPTIYRGTKVRLYSDTYDVHGIQGKVVQVDIAPVIGVDDYSDGIYYVLTEIQGLTLAYAFYAHEIVKDVDNP